MFKMWLWSKENYLLKHVSAPLGRSIDKVPLDDNPNIGYLKQANSSSKSSMQPVA